MYYSGKQELEVSATAWVLYSTVAETVGSGAGTPECKACPGLFPGCVTLGELLHFSVPPFPQLENGGQ